MRPTARHSALVHFFWPLLATVGCGLGATPDLGQPPQASESPSPLAPGMPGTTGGQADGGTPRSPGGPGSTVTHGWGLQQTPAGLPLVPNNGGQVIAAPQLVLISYPGDANRSGLAADVRWLANSDYLPTVGAEYGIGNGSLRADVQLTDAPPPADAIPAYLQSHLSDGSLPTSDPSNIYILVIPQGAPNLATYCSGAAGFHGYFDALDGTQPTYVVIPDCGNDLQRLEVILSHEVVEVASDPHVDTYQMQDPGSPWTYLGGEIGDLCESNSTNVHDPSRTFAAALMWSNAAAASGQVPCVPWPDDQTYVSVLATPSTTQRVAAGSTVTFTLTGWSSQPTGTFALTVQDDPIADVRTQPQLNESRVSPGGQVTVTLQVPVSARAGQSGATWIIAHDPDTGADVGSAVVALQVE